MDSELSHDTPQPPVCAVLDTTIQVDRIKGGSRKGLIESLLSTYDFRFATSLSLVEFKATVIQTCITIHNQLRRRGARFTHARDALLEKNHPQAKLRAHILNNHVGVFGSSFDLTETEDERLAEVARLSLENIIPELYTWFSASGTVDAVLREKLRCDRALEAPKKLRAAYTTNLPACQRGKNKTCRVETLIREEGDKLVDRLRPLMGESDQLRQTIELFGSVKENPKKELSVNDCRRAGDCLIALEATGYATHALSTNSREWAPISRAAGFTFVEVSFPDERTR